MIPCPKGLSYLPFQIEGIEFAKARPATLFADEMGLGKTIQSIGWMNCFPRLEEVLIVCPLTLVINWRRELNKWLISPCVNITIVHYELLKKLDLSRRYNLAVLDEAHYIKSEESKRTQFVYQIQADNKHALSGTPMPNRPLELWPILRWLYPDKFPKKLQRSYSLRYCAGHVEDISFKTRRGYVVRKKVWNENGASNLEELQTNLKKHLMIRRLKANVLKDLPPKCRQIIELPVSGLLKDLRYKLDQAKRKLDFIEMTYYTDLNKLHEELAVAWTEMAELRRETGLNKLHLDVELIQNALASSHKIVVWAYHRDVLEGLYGAFLRYHPVMVHGGITAINRQKAVDAFQNEEHVRIFIGQIEAAGTGLTLHAASHAIFTEEDWTPGAIEQAESRIDRIGQFNPVLIQHAVLEGSLDVRMLRVQERKRAIISEALDARKERM